MRNANIAFLIATFLAFTIPLFSANMAEASDEKVPVIIILKEQPLKGISGVIHAAADAQTEAMVAEAQGIYSKIEQLPKDRKRMMGMDELRQYEQSFLTGEDKKRLGEIGKEIDFIKDEAKRRIIEGVREKTEGVHDSVRNMIERCGGTYTGSSFIINSIAAFLPKSCLNDLQNHEYVLQIIENRKMHVDMDVSAYAVKSDVFWNNSINGSGFEIAILDTGINNSHPALTGSVAAARTFHDDALQDADYADDANSTNDLHSHGTHLAGSAGSRNDTYKGVAFGAKLINSKACFKATDGSGSCYDGDNRRGIDWAVGQGADIISRSIAMCDNGASDCDMARYLDAVVDDLGVHVANSAGNSGPGGSTVGAVAYNAFSVAAANDAGTRHTSDDSIAGFSSRGPSGDGRTKPDITAPGAAIKSANTNWESADDFIDKSGTSMAAPQAAGAIALILDYKGINWNPMAVRALFYNTANDSFPDKSAYGFGYLDMDRAYAYRDDVISSNITEGSFRFYRTQSLLPREKATLVWNRHVVYNGNNSPDTWHALNDLNLYLYDRNNGSLINASESANDSAELVKAGNAQGKAVIKIKAQNANFSHNSDFENYALATEGGFAAVTGPGLNTSKPDAPENTTKRRFNVTVRVDNIGDVEAHNILALLELPNNTNVTAGSNPTNVGSLKKNEAANVTWEVEAREDGNYTFFAKANSTSYGELFENTGANTTVAVDAGAPVVTFVSPTPQDGSHVNYTGVTVNITLNENGNATLEWDNANYTMNGSGSSWHRLMQNQSEGMHSYKVYASDASNNTNSSEIRTVNIDTIIPRVSIIKPDAEFYSSEVPVNISLSENASALNYTANIAGILCSNCTNFNGTLNLSEGIYTITFYATDRAGNTGTNATKNITVDSTAPVINSYNIANGTIIRGAVHEFGMNYTESNINRSVFYWKTNGTDSFNEINSACSNGTNLYCETQLNLSNQSNGTTISFYFFISDNNGRNVTGPAHEAVIDRIAPSITNALPDVTEGVNGQKFTISATVDDANIKSVTARMSYANGAFIENITMTNSSPTYKGTWTAPKTPENYTYTIIAEDMAGNTANTTGNISTGAATPVVTDHPGVCSGSSFTVKGNVTWSNGTGVANRIIAYSGLYSGSTVTGAEGKFSLQFTASASGNTNYTVNNTALSDISSLTVANCGGNNNEEASGNDEAEGGGLNAETAEELPPEEQQQTTEEVPAEEQQAPEATEDIIAPAFIAPVIVGNQTSTGIAGFLAANPTVIGMIAGIGALALYGFYRMNSKTKLRKRKGR